MIDWFENLFGFRETSTEVIKEHIELLDRKLHSRKNGRSYCIGQLTTPTLKDLRLATNQNSILQQGKLKVQNIVAIDCEMFTRRIYDCAARMPHG